MFQQNMCLYPLVLNALFSGQLIHHCFVIFIRRESTSPEDIFYGHISGMDAMARGLRNAAALLESKQLSNLLDDRYASWKTKGGLGQKIIKGKVRGGGCCCFLLLYTISPALISYTQRPGDSGRRCCIVYRLQDHHGCLATSRSSVGRLLHPAVICGCM